MLTLANTPNSKKIAENINWQNLRWIHEKNEKKHKIRIILKQIYNRTRIIISDFLKLFIRIMQQICNFSSGYF